MSPAQMNFYNQDQQPMMEESPQQSPAIMRGIEAGKISAEVTDKQHRRAMARGLGNLLQNFNQAPTGSNFWAKISNAAPAGAMAYQDALENQEKLNYLMAEKAAERQRKENKTNEELDLKRQKLGMEQLYKKMRLGIEQGKLAETKRYHDQSLGKKGTKNTEAHEKIQRDKEVRLLNKNMLDIRKYKDKTIKERMDQLGYMSAKDKVAARARLDKELDGELSPYLEELQGQLNSYKGVSPVSTYNKNLDDEAKSLTEKTAPSPELDEEAALYEELTRLKTGAQ